MNVKAAIRIVIFLLIILGLFLVYRWFINRPDESESVDLVAAGFAEESGPAAEFLEILLSLQKIDLKSDLFTSSTFKSLVDFSVELDEQIPGRVNPYAPIGIGGRPTGFSTTTPSGSGQSAPSGGSGDNFRGQVLDSLLPPR